MRHYFYHSAKRFCLLYAFLLNMHLFVFAQGFSPETQTQLQQVIDHFAGNPAFAGGISAAINVDGLAQWKGASGYAARNVDEQNNLLPGGTLFTTETLSRIYSVTKTFTAALVLELAREGTFKLEDPISKYLPQINSYNPGLNGSVTIRQLLVHESGYQDWEESLEIQMAVAFNPNHIWTPYELIAFTKQINPPGVVRSYSHNNYVFLGAIIEAATGRQVEELYRERFFTPLDFATMFFAGRESIGNRGVLAAPHDNISPFNPIFQLTGQLIFPNAYTNISRFPFTAITSLDFTGGGIVSNASELAQWGNALFGGRATSQPTLDAILNSISSSPDEFGNKLGYGVKNTPFISGEYDFIGHNGSAPGYRSVMFYQPNKKMTIVVLTNFAGVSPFTIAKALYEALPDFTGGHENRKEDKILLCHKGQNISVARPSAAGLLKNGAYLGNCASSQSTGSGKATKTLQPAGRTPDAAKSKTSLSVAPNPLTDHTLVSFKIGQSGPVNLGIYDLNGRVISVLLEKVLEKDAVQQVMVQSGKLPSGTYIVRLQTAGGTYHKKLVVNR